MRSGLGLIAVVAALWALSATAADRFWLKSWVIAGAAGDPAEIAWAKTKIGTSIVLEANRLLDPLTEDCKEGVSYDDVQLRPTKDLGRHFGNFWRWPSLAGSEVAYGWIKCAGSNVGAFAFVDSRHAYRFYENGIVFRLQ